MDRAAWQAAERDYIETEISMSALAKKYGLARSTLRDHAVREGWAERRKAFQIERAAQRLAEAQRAGEAGENPDTLLRVTDKLLRRAEEIADSGGEIGARELGELMRALKSASSIRLAHAVETEEAPEDRALTIRFSTETEEAAQ